MTDHDQKRTIEELLAIRELLETALLTISKVDRKLEKYAIYKGIGIKTDYPYCPKCKNYHFQELECFKPIINSEYSDTLEKP